MSRPGIDFPGVGCGLVIVREQKILLYKRLKPPEANHWTITGGKVDLLEHSSFAALRETAEESGLTVGNADFLCVSEHVLPDDAQHWVSMIYLATDVSGEPQVPEPDKMADCGWFGFDALPAPLSRFAADGIAAARTKLKF